MAFRIRRIITGHDVNGKAVVSAESYIESTPGKIDTNISAADIWSTNSMPPDLYGQDPIQKSLTTTPPPAGTMLKVLELSPGTKPLMHKTETLDYVIVIEGEVDMLLDDCAEVHMRAGDLMIQRATLHGWANRSDKPCRIAFVLVSTKQSQSNV